MKKIVSYNKRVRHDYYVEFTYEAGIILLGNEVKSIRNGQISFGESFISHRAGQLLLKNCHISRYKFDTSNSYYDPIRDRALLLHKTQVKKIRSIISQKGYSAFVLSGYFNDKNIVKLEIGCGKGKKEYDKRATVKDREIQREKVRVVKNSKLIY